jgi:hypothetical protein
MRATLSNTKGSKIKVDFGTKKFSFTAGGKKRFLVEEVYGGKGVVYVNGEIKTETGDRYYALLELDETSSGEYYGGLFFSLTPKGVEVKEILGHIGVHKYKYHTTINAHDHHVGEDGWSI